MSFEFRLCKFEMDFEAYTRFVIQHHDELNLPYSFPVKLSFISSPLIFGRAMLIVSEEPYQMVGAAGFVYGTGSNSYEDKHICQVEVAFLQREYRRTPLFIQGLLALVNEMKAGNPEVETVQFWVSEGQMKTERLFSKLLALPDSDCSTVNNLVCYRVSFQELETYCQRFKSRFQE